MAEDWPRQNGKATISEHINALQARIAELERQRDEVLAVCRRHEGCGYECSAVEEIRAVYGGGQ